MSDNLCWTECGVCAVHRGASWVFWLLRLINTLTYLLTYLFIHLLTYCCEWLSYLTFNIQCFCFLLVLMTKVIDGFAVVTFSQNVF